jgi:hypothetical protein
MTQIDVDDGYIQKVAGILKCKPQYDHKLFRTGKDVVYTALEHVMADNHYEAKLDEKAAQIDALNARIAQLENAIEDIRQR